MAVPRLPFLWPMLFRPSKPPRIRAPRLTKSASASVETPRRGRRQFATAPRRAEEAPTQRYGKAHEPAPHLREQDAARQPGQNTGSKANLEKSESTPPAAEEAKEDEPPTSTTTPLTPSKSSAIGEPEISTPVPESSKTGATKPLDSVLHIPSTQEKEQQKAPHLKTPPYVHHFDTYGLVKELTKSGYRPAQSVLLMKAVRELLVENMALARDGLVSKSNVENETYLFRAACSELKTEIGNSKKGEIERMRTERNQLQHEVDILGQKLGQETSTLKDELKGLFDDRKMAVRQEQRSMDSRIQELNYKITVALNSDARSDVEGLRWVLTRRAAITVGFSAFMLFVALRYTSYVQHQQAEQKRRLASPTNDPPREDQHAARQQVLGSELIAGGGVSLG